MFLYVLTNAAMPDLFKVGFSTDPQQRAASLSAVSGIPFPFEVAAVAHCVSVDMAMRAERIAHLMLDTYRVNHGREFFQMRHVNHAVHAIKIAAFAVKVYVLPSEIQALADELSQWPIDPESAA